MIYASQAQGYENFYNLTLNVESLGLSGSVATAYMYVVYQIFKKLDTWKIYKHIWLLLYVTANVIRIFDK